MTPLMSPNALSDLSNVDRLEASFLRDAQFTLERLQVERDALLGLDPIDLAVVAELTTDIDDVSAEVGLLRLRRSPERSHTIQRRSQ